MPCPNRRALAPRRPKGRAYIEEAIASFDRDPADTSFQRGFLAALKVVQQEAF